MVSPRSTRTISAASRKKMASPSPLLAPTLLLGQQLRVGRSGGGGPLGELVVDPAGVLGRPRRGDLELVRAAVSVAPVEGVPADRPPGQRVQPVEQAETGQLTGL